MNGEPQPSHPSGPTDYQSILNEVVAAYEAAFNDAQRRLGEVQGFGERNPGAVEHPSYLSTLSSVEGKREGLNVIGVILLRHGLVSLDENPEKS